MGEKTMNRLLRLNCYLLFLLILCLLSGCESAARSSGSTTVRPERASAASQLTGPIDGELLNSEEMEKEHLRMIESQKAVLRKLLEENREQLSMISEQMLQLQLEECRTNPMSSKWKHPLFVKGERLFWESNPEPDESIQDALRELETELDAASKGNAFSQAFPDLNQRVIQGSICQFTQELTDSLGDHFCYVSLNYSQEEHPAAQPFFTIEWIDKHWFFYVEWHE